MDDKKMAISIPSQMDTGKNVNLKYLFKHIYDNFLVESEKYVPKRDPQYDPKDPEKLLRFEEAKSVLIEKGEMCVPSFITGVTRLIRIAEDPGILWSSTKQIGSA